MKKRNPACATASATASATATATATATASHHPSANASANASASANPPAPFHPDAAFLGIDVSKAHFDVALCLADGRNRQPTICSRFENNDKGIKAMDKWLSRNGVTDALRPHLLVVMENTGIYHRRLWKYCCEGNLRAAIGNAADIKWSMGITRGKDDVTDSQRICDYAFRHADRLAAAPKFDEQVLGLKDLHALRRRLVKDLKGHQVALKELKGTNSKAAQATISRIADAALCGLAKSLKEVDKAIREVIKSNAAMKKNYDLLVSIPGIGRVTAVYLICCTANFMGAVSGKQLACYAGVAPFEHSSGSSVRGRPKVNKMANKELKTLLHMGARSIAAKNAEARGYYERKAAEGKHDLCIINAIKNKLLLRVAAVIREQRGYVNKSVIKSATAA